MQKLLVPQDCQTTPKRGVGFYGTKTEHTDVSQGMALKVIKTSTISLCAIETFSLIFYDKESLRLAVFNQLSSVVASTKKVGNQYGFGLKC